MQFAPSCCSPEDWCIWHDSVPVPDQRVSVAVVADKLETGVQELQARLCHQHSSPTHVSLSETAHFHLYKLTTNTAIVPLYLLPFFVSNTTIYACCMSWLLHLFIYLLPQYMLKFQWQ
jgi:hypothetical protein